MVVEASAAPANYWLRVDPQIACGSNSNGGNITGYIHYDGAQNDLPSSTQFPYDQSCNDEPLQSLVPVVPINVDPQSFTSQASRIPISGPVQVVTSNGQVFRWKVRGVTMDIDWENPTLRMIQNGNTTWGASQNVIEVPGNNTVS